MTMAFASDSGRRAAYNRRFAATGCNLPATNLIGLGSRANDVSDQLNRLAVNP
jgi:hypothetical protein